MPILQHFAWPFGVGRDGRTATVEQGSDGDIQACIAAIVSWPLGTNDMDPMFGVPEETFLQGGPDLDEIRAGITENEPRALTAIVEDDELLTNFVAQVRIGFDHVTARPAA